MKLFQISFVVILIFSSSIRIFAQDEGKDLSQGINVYLYNGYAAGYRFNECSNSFWRINLDLSSFWNNRKYNSGSWYWSASSSDTSSSEEKSEDSRFSISVLPQYILKVFHSKYITLYSGGGPFAGYTRQESRIKGGYTSDGYSETYRYGISNEYVVGLTLILGFESNIINNISLFAESQLAGSRTWINSDSNTSSDYASGTLTTQYNTGKNNNWSANFILIRAGLNVKF